MRCKLLFDCPHKQCTATRPAARERNFTYFYTLLYLFKLTKKIKCFNNFVIIFPLRQKKLWENDFSQLLYFYIKMNQILISLPL